MNTSCRWQLYNWFGRNRKSSYWINRNKEKRTHKQSLAWSLHDTRGKLTHASMSPRPVSHAHTFSDSCIIKYTRNHSHVKITHLINRQLYTGSTQLDSTRVHSQVILHSPSWKFCTACRWEHEQTTAQKGNATSAHVNSAQLHRG